MNSTTNTNKVRVKVLINWYEEVLTFYTYTAGRKVSETLDPSVEVYKVDENSAVLNAVSQLSKRVGVVKRVVRDYVMEPNKRRWEVIK